MQLLTAKKSKTAESYNPMPVRKLYTGLPEGMQPTNKLNTTSRTSLHIASAPPAAYELECPLQQDVHITKDSRLDILSSCHHGQADPRTSCKMQSVSTTRPC